MSEALILKEIPNSKGAFDAWANEVFIGSMWPTRNGKWSIAIAGRSTFEVDSESAAHDAITAVQDEVIAMYRQAERALKALR